MLEWRLLQPLLNGESSVLKHKCLDKKIHVFRDTERFQVETIICEAFRTVIWIQKNNLQTHIQNHLNISKNIQKHMTTARYKTRSPTMPVLTPLQLLHLFAVLPAPTWVLFMSLWTSQVFPSEFDGNMMAKWYETYSNLIPNQVVYESLWCNVNQLIHPESQWYSKFLHMQRTEEWGFSWWIGAPWSRPAVKYSIVEAW